MSIRCPPVIFVYRPYFLATRAMTASFSGVISPPGTRGTTEYSAAALHVRQEAVVRVLQRLVLGLQDVFVPQAGQDRRDGRLADLAALAAAGSARARRRTSAAPWP